MFEVLDHGDLKAVGQALADLADGADIRKELVKELRAIGNPLVRKVQAAWKAAPSAGHVTSTRDRRGQPDLRMLLAKSTRTEVKLTAKEAGVRVRTDGRRMPDGKKGLPAAAEGTNPRWRHPVFGDRETWVQQRPFPRFYAAVQPDEARARRAAEQAVESVLAKIVKAR